MWNFRCFSVLLRVSNKCTRRAFTTDRYPANKMAGNFKQKAKTIPVAITHEMVLSKPIQSQVVTSWWFGKLTKKLNKRSFSLKEEEKTKLKMTSTLDLITSGANANRWLNAHEEPLASIYSFSS